MWNRFIRPKKRSSNPWQDIATGGVIIIVALALLLIWGQDFSGTTQAIWVIAIVAGVRWVVVGLVHRHDLAGS